MGVSSCCLDLEYTIVNGQKRDIKCSSSKIVNEDLAFVSNAVKTICNRSSRWLVYDSKDVQAGNGSGVLRRLSLAVIKVSGNGDNRVIDLALSKQLSYPHAEDIEIYFSTKIFSGDIFHLTKNH